MGDWISMSGITGRAQVADMNLELVTKEVDVDETTRERKEDQNRALGYSSVRGQQRRRSLGQGQWWESGVWAGPQRIEKCLWKEGVRISVHAAEC